MHLGMPALSWQHAHRRSFSIITDIIPFKSYKTPPQPKRIFLKVSAITLEFQEAGGVVVAGMADKHE